MLRIAKQLIKHKQKSSLLLIGIIALSLALMLATGPMFDTAKAQIFDAYASRYGLQHGAIFYLDADKIEILRQKQEELCYALFQTMESGGYLRHSRMSRSDGFPKKQ